MKLYSKCTFLNIYHVLKLFGRLSSFWPIYCKTRFKQCVIDFIFIIFVLNNFFVLGCLISKIVSLNKITPELTNYIFQISVFAEELFTLLYSKFRESRFKTVLRKIAAYLTEMTKHEQDTLNRYMFRRMPIDMYLITMYFLACDTFIFGPLFLKDKQLPLDLLYPFSTESNKTVIVLYIHQVITSIHSFIIIIFDLTVRLFLWVFAARFELLQNDFQLTASEKQLKLMIQKHQRLLRDTEEAVDFTKYAVLKLFSVGTLTIISSTLQIVHYNSSGIMVRFFVSISTAALRTFTYCWDANDLMEKSADLAWYVYKCEWIKQSNRMRTDVLIIIQRCQKPVIVKIGGFIPQLSFKYYVSYFYMVYSLFMTLRAVI